MYDVCVTSYVSSNFFSGGLPISNALYWKFSECLPLKFGLDDRYLVTRNSDSTTFSKNEVFCM